MWRLAAFIILAACYADCLSAQGDETQGCAARPEFAPVVVSNPDSKVTFKCDRVTPLDLIQAIGRQARIPIGIVLGRDPSILSKPSRSYDLEKVDARLALQEAIQGTGYTLKEENQVMVLVSDNLTTRQEELLTHSYSDFGPGSNLTMVELGVALTMWMRVAIDHIAGFGGSIQGSLNDERFTVKPTQSPTTEEIANEIVSLGSKGIWIFRADPLPTSGASTDEVVIEPYQHYSNSANVDH